MLEFAGPVAAPIQAAADEIVAAGATHVVAQPVLLFHAGHDKDDMPAHYRQMTTRHPNVEFRLGRPFGMRQELIDVAHARALAALQDLGSAGDPVGLLLVARGTHHAEANGDMWKLARLFWERHRQDFPLVEAAFVSLAEPFVPEGITRLQALGARRIVVTPYFINTGILVRRIVEQAKRTAADLQDVRLAVSSHIGVDERLVALICDEAGRTEHLPRAGEELS